MREPLVLCRICVICVGIVIPAASALIGQNVPSPGQDGLRVPLYFRPYADPHVFRTGVEGGGEAGRYRLGLWGTIPVYSIPQRTEHFTSYFFDGGWYEGDTWICSPIWGDRPEAKSNWVESGLEFFTTSSASFSEGVSFPVESLGYYLGTYGAVRIWDGRFTNTTLIPSFRLAYARSWSFIDRLDPAAPTTGATEEWSGDVSVAAEYLALPETRRNKAQQTSLDMQRLLLRPYAGARWTFSATPDELEEIQPYLGFDMGFQFHPKTPLALRTGCELYLRTAGTNMIESSVRAGLKLAELYENGVVIEWAWRSSDVIPLGEPVEPGGINTIGFSVEH